MRILSSDFEISVPSQAPAQRDGRNGAFKALAVAVAGVCIAIFWIATLLFIVPPMVR